MKKSFIPTALLVVFVLIGFAGCDLLGLTNIDISGTWKLVSKIIDGTFTNVAASNEIYTFNAGGTASATKGALTDSTISYEAKGQKVFISGVSLNFTLQNSVTSYPYTASVSGTTLTLENNAGGAIGTTKFVFSKM